MPRLRKLLFNSRVYFITTSVEEGLPFAPNPLMKALIESAMARALRHHPIRICHHLFEANHLHMIAMVDDAKNLKGFMERLKTETAHSVNRLLGRKKRTIWCERYDSPLLLTVEDVIKRIVYLYSNPAKDNLEDSIDKYPGISSWKAFMHNKCSRICPWIRRSDVFPLHSTALTLNQYEGLTRRLKNKAAVSHKFTIYPNAWMEAFGILDRKEQDVLNKEIVTRVREEEEGRRKIRREQGRTVIGAERLVLKPIDSAYTPERSGRMMWCICSDFELRKSFISYIKALVLRAMDAYERWKKGDMSFAFPQALYPPAAICLAKSVPLSFEC